MRHGNITHSEFGSAFGWPQAATTVPGRPPHPSPFSCSAGAPFSRPGLTSSCHGAERRGWEERSHPQPRAARYSEHGEDGEHRTFPEASTMARSRSAALPPAQPKHPRHDLVPIIKKEIRTRPPPPPGPPVTPVTGPPRNPPAPDTPGPNAAAGGCRPFR